MNERFREHVEALHPSYERLMSMRPVKVCALPKSMAAQGVYLFSEGNSHLYVGRTGRLRQRLQEHCRNSSGNNTAPFAFLLARDATGMMTAAYRTEGSRKSLELHAVFGPAFVEAKTRIRNMDVRFVEETDPTRQALLEIYVAVATAARHNSFENS